MKVTGRQRFGHHVAEQKNTLSDDGDDPPKRGAGVNRRLSETWETTGWKPHKTWVLVLENRIVWAASVGCSVPLTRPPTGREAGTWDECSGRGAIGLMTRTMVALVGEEGATASKDAPLQRSGRSGFRRSRTCGTRYDGRLLDACPADP
jgi:hypothetical protein